MTRTAVIGLDLGGTKLAGAIFTPQGRILCKRRRPPRRPPGATPSVELIRQRTQQLLAAARAQASSTSPPSASPFPGISYSSTGKVWAPNIPGWEDYPLRRELLAAVQDKRIRVVIDSDRACYILGETWRGVAKGCRNAIFLAVGTGIGAGILIDGRVLRGAHDIAGAIGWLALDRPFRREYVGCGCFEYHASGDGLAKVRRDEPRAATGPSSCYGARKCSPPTTAATRLARAVIAQAIGFWGMAVANLVSLFNPEKIIFGGGVFGPGARLLGEVYAEAKKWAQPISIRQVKLQASKLGGDAGLYGAGRLALGAAHKS